jgi:hypothetical protein
MNLIHCENITLLHMLHILCAKQPVEQAKRPTEQAKQLAEQAK